MADIKSVGRSLCSCTPICSAELSTAWWWDCGFPVQEEKTGQHGTERMSGMTKEKHNYWICGNGFYSFRWELKRWISLNKKKLKQKVRQSVDTDIVLKDNGHRKYFRQSIGIILLKGQPCIFAYGVHVFYCKSRGTVIWRLIDFEEWRGRYE